MNLIHLIATRSLLILTVPFLSACNGMNQQTAQFETTSGFAPSPKTADSAILSELAIIPDPLVMMNTPGPQLVAGDWIAWQCAIAANYWDIPTKNAPAYAEASESDLTE